jgi:hypothetical protein
MIIAWALDQVIDLNNGLDVSHPLTFNEEILCLSTLFSYSITCVLVSLSNKYLCEKDDTLQEDESLSQLMTVLFTLLAVFMPLNTFVRTNLDSYDSDHYLHL